ncbi:MFS transporter [Streptomyces sp. STR69]|uniref:MFS transporter n=1 Tax=Streptomyces sp. STR69 TaxID=1796942 RepID=UPI0021C60F16|nr:MFS transporter [Streptomyces sp. STR69]
MPNRPPPGGVASRLRTLADTLMLGRRETRLLLLTAGVDSFGTGLYSATSILFFTLVRDFSVTSVGLGISAGSVCALLISPQIGRLADRMGAHRALMLLFLVRAAGYSLYLLAKPYWAFVLLTCLVSTADRASPAINQSLMGALFGEKDRATILGTVFSVRNAAIVLGSMAATLPVMLDSPSLYQACILANAASFIAAATLLVRMRASAEAATGTGPKTAERTAAAGVRSPLRSPAYLLITAVNAALLTHNTILTLVLPLWITSHTDAPRWMLTTLLALNGVLAMLAQIPVNRRFSSYRAATRASALSGAAIGVACLVYAASGAATSALGATALLLLAVLAHSAGECLHIASTPLSFSLSPPQARGRYLTFYNLGRVGQDLVGPVLLGTALLHHTWAWWAVAAGVATAGALPLLLLRGPAPVWATPVRATVADSGSPGRLTPQGHDHADQ